MKKIDKFKNFLKDYKYGIFIVILISLSVFIYNLTSNSFGIDTEEYLYYKDNYLNVWISISRPFLVILKKFTLLNILNLKFTSFLTYLFFMAYLILLFYFYKDILKFKNDTNFKKNLRMILFCSIISTSLIYVHHFYFLLQSAEVAFMLIISLFSMKFIEEGIENKNIIYNILGILLLSFCIGTYQSFTNVYIVMSVIYIFDIINNKPNISTANIFKKIGILILNLIIALILYFCLYSLLSWYSNIEPANYLMEKIMWEKDSITTCIKSILIGIRNTYFGIFVGQTHYYNYLNFISFVIILMSIIKEIISKEKNIFKIIIMLCIILSPFSLTILLGSSASELYRTKIALPIIIAFSCVFIGYNIIKNYKVYIVYTILLSIFIYYQIIISVRYIDSDQLRFQQDVNFSTVLYNDLSKYNIKNKPLVILGYKEYNNVPYKGEVIGSSFFAFDRYYVVGVNQRSSHFMNLMGFPVIDCSIEDYNNALNYFNELNTYPNSGSIIETENYVIVKISDNL